MVGRGENNTLLIFQMASCQGSFPIYGKTRREQYPSYFQMASYQASSPRVTTIKKDCRTSIGSHVSLSLGRVRMVASLPFPVLSIEQIQLRMNLERCPLEIKLIILLQVIQNKIDMFQTWDDVSMLFYRKVFFSQVNQWFVFFFS